MAAIKNKLEFLCDNKTSLEKPRGNDLTGKDWIKNSVSVWSEIQKDSDEKKLNHPAVFPWKLAYRIIETFTNTCQKNILDPFVGTGSTLLACNKLNKNGIGFDIDKEYINLTKKRINQESFKNKLNFKVIRDDVLNIEKHIPKNSIDLCFTSPPYWNILSRKRTADNKNTKDYNSLVKNVGNISSYKEYILAIQNIFEKVYNLLKPNSYCIINVMDLRKKKDFYPLHMDLSLAFNSIGYVLDDIIIWDRRQDYNNLKPLGYPHVFRINKVHEFLMIFKKIVEDRK